MNLCLVIIFALSAFPLFGQESASKPNTFFIRAAHLEKEEKIYKALLLYLLDAHDESQNKEMRAEAAYHAGRILTDKIGNYYIGEKYLIYSQSNNNPNAQEKIYSLIKLKQKYRDLAFKAQIENKLDDAIQLLLKSAGMLDIEAMNRLSQIYREQEDTESIDYWMDAAEYYTRWNREKHDFKPNKEDLLPLAPYIEKLLYAECKALAKDLDPSLDEPD